MDYDVSQSSGTDDDLPHQNRVSRSRFAGNKRSVLSSISHHSMYANMEVQIHHLEQEAYCAVLRAFKAQSDALTWEKEGLITELRKELRVSDDEHRELLTRVNSDEIIGRIREWRNTGGHQASRLNASQPVYDPISSPTISASRKKHKTSQPQFSSLSSMKPMHYPPAVQAGSRQFNNRSSAAGFIQESAENASSDPLIGRKVWTRWPEDNNFYEAVITEYNPVEGRHALVYDIYTPNETWEWVDLKEILPEDIRWEDGGLSVSHRGGHRVPGRGVKKSVNRTVVIPDAGRGREPEKSNPKKDFPPSQNGIGKKILDDIELLNTDSLVKEVESVFNTNDPDPFELEKAKKMLKVRSTSRHLLMPLQSLLIHPMVTMMGSIYIHMVGHWRKNEAI